MIHNLQYLQTRNELYNALDSARRAIEYVGTTFIPVDVKEFERHSHSWTPLSCDRARGACYLCADLIDGVREIMFRIDPGGEIFPHKYGDRCFRLDVVDGSLTEKVSGNVYKVGDVLEIKAGDKKHFISNSGATFVLYYKNKK